MICGYQGWFATPGDGAFNSWAHWARGEPKKGFQSFELYPDISEYDRADLFQTGYEPFPNGTPSTLFSSCKITVTDLHFKWMYQYGIDGIALQRFMVATPAGKVERLNKVLDNIIVCAEKYGRIFYMCYDFSGFKSDNFVSDFINDFEKTIVEKHHAVKSPAYLKVNGKPVVQLWGIGFSDRNNDPDDFAKIIRHLQNNGYYVIGGVPTHWRAGTKDALNTFDGVFAMLDMVSPWLVGRFRDTDGIVSQYENTTAGDIKFCESRGQDYMPVIFPGFAWSNWKDSKANAIPRAAGEFMWKQAEEAVKLKPSALYVAMFDEYDEATAIMKMATDSSVIPSDQYFLTGSADNIFVSPDFYLRLTGEINKMFKSGREPGGIADIPYSEGPVFLRTAFEPGLDVYTEPEAGSANRGFCGTVTRIDNSIATNSPAVPVKSGKSSVQIKGIIEANGMMSYKLLDISYIIAQPGMILEFNFYIVSGTNISLTLTAAGGKKKISKIITGAGGEWINAKTDMQELEGLRLAEIGVECQDIGELEAYLDDVSIYVPEEMREIYFAGGCFWGVEEYFSRIPGVKDVTSGYANGTKENPSYEEVCSGETGHIEAVHVRYDPKKVSLKTLTEQLFKVINPVSVSRQQYRNGIYFVNDEDAAVVSSVMADEQKNHDKPLTVEAAPLKCYYLAEDYHQDYLKKNPGGHCHITLLQN